MLNKIRKEIQVVLMLSFLLGASEFLLKFYSSFKPTFLVSKIPNLIAYNFVLHILMVGIIFLISSLLLKILNVFLRWFPVTINFNASIIKIALTLSFLLFYWISSPVSFSRTQYFLFCLGIIGILVYIGHIIYKKFKRHVKMLIYGYAAALFITCCALITWSIYTRITEQPFKGNYTTQLPNIVYIVVDTLRADALSCYGNKKTTTPAMDALASDGILFENAYASSSWTIPGTTTLLTSQNPLSLRMMHHSSVMPEEATLVGEALKEKGYMTAAIIGNVLVNEQIGFNQGFEYFDWDANFFYDSFVGVMLFNSTLRFLKKWYTISYEFIPVLDFSSPYFISYEMNSYRDANDITSNAVKLIERFSLSSFFLYLHYFDPHAPYFKHPTGNLLNLEADFTKGRFTVLNKDEFSDLYLSEVEYSDKHIGYLIDNLKNKGIYDNTIIILTSDHGEQLLDHGHLGHTISLYNEELRVPLIIKGIENNRGVKFSPPTSTIDILPTVFDMLKINHPESFQGKSLTPFINKTVDKTKDDYVSAILLPSYTNPKDPNFIYALMKDDYKYIISSRIDVKHPIKAGKEELYDLQTDKDEKNNIASENPEVIAKFRKVLSEHIKKIPKPGDIKEKPLNTSQHKRLKALGYIQ
jgi:arylsulfatase